MSGRGAGSGTALRVAVCLSTAVDPDADAGPDRLRDAAAGLRRVVNPADRSALEAALRLRDARPDTRITALSVAPPEREEVLRWAYMLAADELELLWSPGLAGADAMTVASTLAAAADRLGAGAVLCGRRTLDGNGGGVGPALAERLGVTAVTGVTALRIEGRVARAQRRLGGGLRAEVECHLPAVFVIEEGSMEPRYPRLRDRFRALREPVRVTDPASPEAGGATGGESAWGVWVESLTRPRPVTAGIFVPDQALSPEDQLRQLMGGVAPAARPAGPGSGGGLEEALRLLEEGGFLE